MDNEIRIMNGTTPWNGRLEICLGGVWGAVCEDKFEDIDAQVACRQLGFSTKSEDTATHLQPTLSLSLSLSLSLTHTHTLSLSYSHTLDASVVPGGTFGEGARMWIKDVECRGYEDKLYQCQSSSPGYFHGCRPHNSTGIWCAGQCMPLTSLSVSQHGLGQGVGTSNTVIQVMCCSD